MQFENFEKNSLTAMKNSNQRKIFKFIESEVSSRLILK